MMLCSLIALPFIASANAATTPTLTASATDESNVISVEGEDFDTSETVHIALLNETDGTTVYNFTETITTDSSGDFTADLTLPDVYGTYNLTACTSTIQAYTEFTIILSETPALTVTPDDSNIIAVSGSGFNTSETVTLTLEDSDNETIYTFTEDLTTNTLGNFTAAVIIPTSINGDYTLIAETETGATANATITVPDLTGATGATGATGLSGEAGVDGEDGAAADNTIVYSAVILSIAAIAIAAVALTKKH